MWSRMEISHLVRVVRVNALRKLCRFYRYDFFWCVLAGFRCKMYVLFWVAVKSLKASRGSHLRI